MKTLTEKQFHEQFTPLHNPREDSERFETYGPDLETVRSALANNVWTMIEGDDDSMWLIAGIHHVNRMYYVITEQPWTEEIQVEIDCPSCCCQCGLETCSNKHECMD